MVFNKNLNILKTKWTPSNFTLDEEINKAKDKGVWGKGYVSFYPKDCFLGF